MAGQNSFDIVSKIDLQEVRNAVDQAMKEIKQRFDFKGSKSDITLDDKEKAMILLSDDENKLKSVIDILQTKIIKRGISLKALTYEKIEQASGGTVRQKIKLQDGIPQEKAKEIIKIIKDAKLKVQSQIQGDQLRVTGKNRDDLQTVIALLKEKDLGIDMQFVNYRSS
ncbi:MAG: YajQ family cyclic di-GMP-binding protein [Nitrospirae bacterium]|nr:YajQ family cyclic di-GMP-binding protein [Nitrospirota bacterium]